MFDFKNIVTALLAVFIAGSALMAQEQGQPLNFYTCNESFEVFYPVEFEGIPATDGWAVQALCAGLDGVINPPDEQGNPTGDDFLAHPQYNNLQIFYFNAAENGMPTGNFWMLKSLNCRAADFLPGEEIIRVGDVIYLRAWNGENPAEATEYSDLQSTYSVSLQTPGLPLDVYGIQFNPSGIGDDKAGLVITEYKLYQNYPNPFNPSTSIQYDVLESGKVHLTIFNIAGQEVARLVNGAFREGGKRYTVQWNAENISSGIYFYRLQVNDFKTVKKLLLLR